MYSYTGRGRIQPNVHCDSLTTKGTNILHVDANEHHQQPARRRRAAPSEALTHSSNAKGLLNAWMNQFPEAPILRSGFSVKIQFVDSFAQP